MRATQMQLFAIIVWLHFPAEAQAEIRNADGNIVSTWCSTNANRERIRRCCDASWQLSRVLVVNNRHSVIRERSQRQEGLHPSKRGHQSNGGPIQKLCSRSPRPTAPVSRQSRRRGLRVGLPLPPVGGGSVGCVQNRVP